MRLLLLHLIFPPAMLCDRRRCAALCCVLGLTGLLGACEPDQPAAGAATRPAAAVDPATPARFLARLDAHTEEEMLELLRRAEASLGEGREYPQFEPVEFILHGREATFFLRSNYQQYRGIVDLAARLDAFGIIDMKICEAWMASRNVTRGELPAFVETVPYGPATEDRLQRDGYIYF